MKRARTASIVLGVCASYLAVLRPRLLRWGASDKEVARVFPGAAIVPGGTRSATMAVTLDAPPASVWPWLAQMGTDRAGWYSWDRLDNWGRKSHDQIHPEWQAVALCDRFFGTPDGSQAWVVAGLEPERVLNLRISLDLRGRQYDPDSEPRPKHFTDSTWGFQLIELPGDRTRLIVSGYWAVGPSWLRPIISILMLEPSHWVMQTRQFNNLARRISAGPMTRSQES